MPRDNDKNNNSPRGRRDRPPAQKPLRRRPRARRRSSPNAVLAARILPESATATSPMVSGVRTPPNPTAPSRMARNPIRARASPTPASARAFRHAGMMTARVGILATLRVRVQPGRPSPRRSSGPRTAQGFSPARGSRRREAPVHAARRSPGLQSRRRGTAPGSQGRPEGSLRCAPGRTLRGEEVR